MSNSKLLLLVLPQLLLHSVLVSLLFYHSSLHLLPLFLLHAQQVLLPLCFI